MTNEQIGKWLSNLKDDMGQTQHRELWHYAEALDMAIEALSNSQKQSNLLIRTSADAVSATDVIYRQDAIEELRDVIVKDVQFGDELTDGYNDGIDMAITVISKLPSAQSERKKGKWIPVNNGRGGHECDQCHNYAPEWQTGEECLTDFCPNCGADMRYETNDV